MDSSTLTQYRDADTNVKFMTSKKGQHLKINQDQ